MMNQGPTCSVADCRSLVKTLVSGVKTITWGAASCKAPNIGQYEHVILGALIGLSVSLICWFIYWLVFSYHDILLHYITLIEQHMSINSINP